jgi:hypothetical protein
MQYFLIEKSPHRNMALPETISTQVPIPSALYQAIAQRAKAQGNSITHEILQLLSGSLEMDALGHEITLWEAASDEDYLSFETCGKRPATKIT